MTADQLTGVLAERVMQWGVAPDRFLLGGRRWLPRWRFQPLKRLADAFRLLENATAQEYTMGIEEGGFWAKVRVAGNSGEAHELCQARAITFAVARAFGIEPGASEPSQAERRRR